MTQMKVVCYSSLYNYIYHYSSHHSWLATVLGKSIQSDIYICMTECSTVQHSSLRNHSDLHMIFYLNNHHLLNFFYFLNRSHSLHLNNLSRQLWKLCMF